MSACQAALAPEAGVIAPKNKIDDNLLNILVNDPAGASVIGLPVPSAPEDAAEAKTEESLAQQAEILSGFPRRYATVEEVDEAIGKNRSRFLAALAIGILTELFLFSMTISPFHTGGVARALAQTLTNVSALWKFTILVRGIYVAILFAYSSKAYFAKAAISGDWRAVCNIALGGMLLELVFTLLVKRLNIIAFVTRGLIAFYATTLASIVAATSNEYVTVAPPTETV
ncbi:hypothetical protein, conserved [Eimeria acervulina]|uniref:Uncharacterized protein n=1 Tax=Eimeria acervulina TaxID=5801 RepID=U6GAX4_EIMAC|nr:hypothetical protein, conserved [Eimeria acervulina]CDI76483.1 hypothetical protein, conserved [Eimeria acervulina]